MRAKLKFLVMHIFAYELHSAIKVVPSEMGKRFANFGFQIKLTFMKELQNNIIFITNHKQPIV